MGSFQAIRYICQFFLLIFYLIYNPIIFLLTKFSCAVKHGNKFLSICRGKHCTQFWGLQSEIIVSYLFLLYFSCLVQFKRSMFVVSVHFTNIEIFLGSLQGVLYINIWQCLSTVSPCVQCGSFCSSYCIQYSYFLILLYISFSLYLFTFSLNVISLFLKSYCPFPYTYKSTHFLHSVESMRLTQWHHTVLFL